MLFLLIHVVVVLQIIGLADASLFFLTLMFLLKLSNKKFNQTVVIITHDLEIAKEAERVITIEDGKIIKDEKNFAQ